MNTATQESTLIGHSPAGVEWRAYADRHDADDIRTMKKALAKLWSRHNSKRTDRVRVTGLTSAQMFNLTDHLDLVAEAEGVDAEEIHVGKTFVEAPARLIHFTESRLEDEASWCNPEHAENEGWNPNCDNLGEAKFAVRQQRKSLQATARKCREALEVK